MPPSGVRRPTRVPVSAFAYLHFEETEKKEETDTPGCEESVRRLVVLVRFSFQLRLCCPDCQAVGRSLCRFVHAL